MTRYMFQNDNHHIDELMLAFRQGDEGAFDTIFSELYASLLFYSSKITSNQQSSEEIASEAFVKVWQRREMFFRYDVLKSYLYKIVKNASLDCIRSQKRRGKVVAGLAIITPASEAASWENLVHTELIRNLYTAIENFPPQRKKVFKMLYQEGMSVVEVAKALKITPSTVKEHKKTGLTFMRKIISMLIISIIMLW